MEIQDAFPIDPLRIQLRKQRIRAAHARTEPLWTETRRKAMKSLTSGGRLTVTLKHAANQLGISESSVHLYLRRNGIRPFLPRAASADTLEARMFLTERMNDSGKLSILLAEAARQLNITIQQLEGLLRKMRRPPK